MQNQIIEDMAFDLNIEPYPGEETQLYQSRILYSALSLWMKYIILDHMVSKEELEIKTKNYHYRKSNKVLEEFTGLFPSFKDWVNPNGNLNPIHEIRRLLMASGEVLEADLDGNISLAQPRKKVINNKVTRLIDLDSKVNQFKYVGLTKIIDEGLEGNFELLSESSLDFIKKFINPNIYIKLSSVDFEYELYNTKRTKKHHKHWIWSAQINNEINIIRTSTGIEKFWEYSLILKQGGSYFQYEIDEGLIKQGIHLKMILGISQLYKNPIKAYYQKKGPIIELLLERLLPRYEEGVLRTYAWPKNSLVDRLSYIVPIELWQEISKMLEIIGYELIKM